jgi:hypothetical protein
MCQRGASVKNVSRQELRAQLSDGAIGNGDGCFQVPFDNWVKSDMTDLALTNSTGTHDGLVQLLCGSVRVLDLAQSLQDITLCQHAAFASALELGDFG